MLRLDNVTKLLREDRDVYLKICTLNTIRSWGLEKIQPELKQEQAVVIGYNSLRLHSKKVIVVDKPLLLTLLPNGMESDVYAVIIIDLEHHLPRFVEEQLLEISAFRKLIETKGKISGNSTKLLTMSGLREILNNVFSACVIEYSVWDDLGVCLVKYINDLLNSYAFLNYLSVKERKLYRSSSVGDLGLAWELYIRYFFEQWNKYHDFIPIPDLDRSYIDGEFRGSFFSRANPIWQELVGSQLKFILSNTQKELLYRKWALWLGER